MSTYSNYINSEFSKLQTLEEGAMIKVNNAYGETKWLSIDADTLEQIKKLIIEQENRSLHTDK